MKQTYRRYGFFVSASVHLGLWGTALWLWLPYQAGRVVPQPTEVPVELSMFAPAPEPFLPEPANEPPEPKPVQPQPLEPPPPPPPPQLEPRVVEAIPVKEEPAPLPPKPAPRKRQATQPRKVVQVPRTPPKPVATVISTTEASPLPQALVRQAAPPVSQAEVAEERRQRELAKKMYLARLQAAIERHKYYPRLARRRGEEGRVLLELSIGADGDFQSVRIERSSGHRRLDEAAVKTLNRIARGEPLPDELGMQTWRVLIPMVFSLRERGT